MVSIYSKILYSTFICQKVVYKYCHNINGITNLWCSYRLNVLFTVQIMYSSKQSAARNVSVLLKARWVSQSEKNCEQNALSNNMLLWMHHKVALLYSEQREDMRIEMRSKGSHRKWVLFVLCGTRYFIKPVYVRYIVYVTGALSTLETRA